MKLTERILVDMCRRVNNDQLKTWEFGLKDERRGDEYVMIQLYRKPQKDRPGSQDIFRGNPREVKAFIEGVASAAGFAKDGAGGGSESLLDDFK